MKWLILHILLIFLLFSPTKVASEGGETPIINSRRVLEIIQKEKPQYLEKLMTKKICYRRFFVHEKNRDKYVKMGTIGVISWQESFQTKDPKVVEKECPASGFPVLSWTDEGDLIVQTPPLSPVVKHPVTGEDVWFAAIAGWDPRTGLLYVYSESDYSDNSAHQKLVDTLSFDDLFKISLYAVVFGDDNQPLDLEISQYLHKVTWENKLQFQWKIGDVMIVDNYAAAHGRNQYRGDRFLLVSPK